ncbi:hypothetical protein HHK36_023199 [Tetracentron sinense]|uniref:COX assembly mitochondrial protein n=1 Tax=Tetracentron sinense TaxID=13715 RepID=A0A834YPT8_TETSI|nr:hypothetical protein HHK36_023199 [Tetracentron sinense]
MAERESVSVGKCEPLERAFMECLRRVPAGVQRDMACRHLNQSLANCLVSVACPREWEAVQSLCSSTGTSLKRSQCLQAQHSLSFCLSSLPQPQLETQTLF